MKSENSFTSLPEVNKINIFSEVATRKALPPVAIEKDWWVAVVLRALFSLPYAEHLSLKGGTSLSKCWNLIARFSEDIDIAVNREFLGFSGTLSKTQISDRLRRSACSFVREKLQFDLKKQLEINDVDCNQFSANVNITPITTTDPEIIEIVYQSLFDDNDYLKPVVKLEVSGRSMTEPLESVMLSSFVGEVFPDLFFSEKPFQVNVVVPERTFLEKIFLLHEEFSKPQTFVRTERLSRHLYDLAQISNTAVAEKALKNTALYENVVNHRRIFIGLKGFDYDSLSPGTINIIPPEDTIIHWQNDYEIMRKTMIYGQPLPFDKLIDTLKRMNQKINSMKL